MRTRSSGCSAVRVYVGEVCMWVSECGRVSGCGSLCMGEWVCVAVGLYVGVCVSGCGCKSVFISG